MDQNSAAVWLAIAGVVVFVIIYSRATPENRRALGWTLLIVAAIVVISMFEHSVPMP